MSRFVYGSRSNVPEYVVRGGVTYRVLSDHLGSPRALVDVATGTAAWRADFDAWGNRTLIAGAADFVPFGFAGGMFDHETGLTRFGARDYDPVAGRWTAKDPVGLEASGTNLFGYALLDPVNRKDLTGADPLDDLSKFFQDNPTTCKVLINLFTAGCLYGCTGLLALPPPKGEVAFAACVAACFAGGAFGLPACKPPKPEPNDACE
ncbi:MAG: RHS domain-containing protein [Polyangiaceae bacterium]|nr:RHS domain-containing protein [Polyangiaceae bacterium]